MEHGDTTRQDRNCAVAAHRSGILIRQILDRSDRVDGVSSVTAAGRPSRRRLLAVMAFVGFGLMIAGLVSCGVSVDDEAASTMSSGEPQMLMADDAASDFKNAPGDFDADESAGYDGGFGGGAAGEEQSSRDTAESAAPVPGIAPAPAPADAPTADRQAVTAADTPLESGRDIIYSARMNVEADDVADAAREAVAIVESFGGIVFAHVTETEPEPSARLTFKVRPADFSEVTDRLAAVGELVDQTLTAEDVTERVVDLESRITTAEVSVARLRELLEDADRLEDVAQIERELMNRETTLETLRAQLRTLQGRVQLATITLTISQSPRVLPDSGIVVTAWLSEDAEDPCLGTDHLTVGSNTTVYFCVEVENVGAAVLTDVQFSSENLRLNTDAFTVTQGSLERIEPGKLLVATLAEPVADGRLAGRVVTRGYQIAIEAEAVPLDAEGTALHEVSALSYVWINAREDESLPGFGDSVAEGAGWLSSVIGVVVVIAGLLVPFAPFAAALAALIWWRTHRRRQRKTLKPTAPGHSGASAQPDDTNE